MSTRYATVIVVAEDERSANLLRRYAERALDANKWRIRQKISPSATGDAKQWVINRYSIEVKELRRMLSHICLLVHLDADVETVTRRLNQLSDALTNDGQIPRRQDERISHVVPRRHTETWLCALTGIGVNEDQDCKRQHLPREPEKAVKPAADQLYALTRANAPAPSLPSLAAAITELRRLEG
jgi:hypothetical protein